MIFVKADSVDWTLPGNQDQITGDVWITRQNTRSIFNIASETEFDYDYGTSPAGTEWAIGSINDWNKLTYVNFIDITNWWPPDMIGENLVMHLKDDNIYLSVRFLSWTTGDSQEHGRGGGFSYIRSTEAAPPGYVPTVWNDPARTKTFVKADSADWTQAGNQDRITNKVWITRQDTGGIYNVVEEPGVRNMLDNSNFPGSPAATEWAIGTAARYDTLTYRRFTQLCGWDPPSLVGQDLVLHLIDDDIYLNIKFLTWTAGGGYSYVRSAKPIPPPTVWNDTSRMIFVKADSVDWTLPGNQDQITGDVWITRQNTRSIFNIASETEFDYDYGTSPAGTEWAIGSINDWNKLTYVNFIDITNWWPPDMIGENLVMHLKDDNIYLSVRFLSWTTGDSQEHGRGGGFSYIRSTEAAPPGYVPTVWNDPARTKTFVKADSADWTQAGNQDRITNKVWITRQDTGCIYNVVEESGVRRMLGSNNFPGFPAGTEWAIGTAANYDTLTYRRFTQLCDWDPPSLVGQDLVLHLIDNDIYLNIKFLTWTSGGGFSYIRSEANPLVSVKSGIDVSVPKIFTLSQNYPNPFNPITTIVFTLAEDGKVSLKVYDILGRQVATLVNEELKSGVLHKVSFNASQLSSGIYFYRLSSSKNSLVKKFVLMK
jgi:hypothetical protein